MPKPPRRPDLGPEGAARLAADQITVDRICGDWVVHQLRGGHRFSTDDMLTAWAGAEAMPAPGRYLDIGAGVGSVGLLCLWRLAADTQALFVEVQEISHRLCRKSIEINGLSTRVTLRHQDLRDPDLLPHIHKVYPLVTGSPPYIPLGKGVVSPHPQRAGARMELRGDVFDYCRTAAHALAPGGRFVFVHSAVDPRPDQAPEAAGLKIVRKQDVYFRRNRAPTIALWTCARADDPTPRQDPPPLVIREADGAFTPDYLAVRGTMGAPEVRAPVEDAAGPPRG